MSVVSVSKGTPKHSVFYYPYATFRGDDARLLLRVAAFYFDELRLLDPLKAIGGGVRIANEVSDELQLLESAGDGIGFRLVRTSPAEVLAQFDAAIAAAVRDDLRDPEFVRLCEQNSQGRLWTIALAKVPQELRDQPGFGVQEQAMQNTLGELPRSLFPSAPNYVEVLQHATAYEEVGGTDAMPQEFRYIDLPLAVGESIMLNHALFASFLQPNPATSATPVTTDQFHDQVLRLKIRRALRDPQIKQAIEARIGQTRDEFAALGVLADKGLSLPILDLAVPLEEVLNVREKCRAELNELRRQLGLFARTVNGEPWTPEFEQDLSRTVASDLSPKIDEARAALTSARRSRIGIVLSGLSVPPAVAVALVPLVVAAAPALPISVAIVAAAVTTAAVGAFGVYNRWMQGKEIGNGLQYLLRIKK